MMTAFDFEPICFANMPLASYDYMAHGSDSEFTLRRNREAFDWVELVERPGTSPDAVNTATEVLGIRMEYPIFVAPAPGSAICTPTATPACTRERPPPARR
jgi:isopentenyl diphosphate isomerase/L-lactate dehydrogenase-like FMN-dependent dehydrogenase